MPWSSLVASRAAVNTPARVRARIPTLPHVLPTRTTLCCMSTGLSQINRVLNQIPKRAEQRQTNQLRDTFVDSGVAAVLQGVDHQALYGRRGTGKTHALRYLGVNPARTR